MILRFLVVALLWAAFFGLVGLVVLGAFAMYHTLMGWLTGEEWTP